MIETLFTRLFGLRHPIMQAPMGSISSPELVAAVSNAGGMGMLALVGVLPDDMRAQIRAVRAQTDKPFGANLIVPLMFPEQLDVCIGERVPLVSFFWGDPAPYVQAVHAAGLKVMVQVGSADEATAARAASVDLIVAQGVEAGGHVRGTTTSMIVVPAVVDAVRPLPVLAAGGIADGRGLAAALTLGAAGVAIGTRFLASRECAAHPEYKQRVVSAGATDTVHNALFDMEWPDAPLRSLRNATLDAWERAGRPPRGARPGEGDMIGAVRHGELSLPVPRYSAVCASVAFQGAVEETALYAGQSCELVRDIRPAGTIVTDIAREAEDALRRAIGDGHS